MLSQLFFPPNNTPPPFPLLDSPPPLCLAECLTSSPLGQMVLLVNQSFTFPPPVSYPAFPSCPHNRPKATSGMAWSITGAIFCVWGPGSFPISFVRSNIHKWPMSFHSEIPSHQTEPPIPQSGALELRNFSFLGGFPLRVLQYCVTLI